MLKNIAAILDQCKIDYWLEGGTLLGIIRENRLLPWDNDIDISINHDQLDKLDSLYSGLKKAGYRVRTRRFGNTNNYFTKGAVRMIKIREKRFFGLMKGSVCLDIFIKYQFKEDSYWEINHITKSVPSKFYLTFKDIKFNDFDYKIPALTDEYLTYRYGDWQKQVKNWNTFKDDNAIT
ncbi:MULTISPECIES: LicD family protein [unclassified Arenibacter]|uniref:LicD family protein n=1 Tax=unclassified Arenibacter TaxID=2615047 RepID=UPI0015F2A69F|nr:MULTISPECIES: LicD family protein [unclassified Arenibacter]